MTRDFALSSAVVHRLCLIARYSVLLALWAMAFTEQSYASDGAKPELGPESGMITKKIGKVTLLLDPHPSRQGAGPHVKYDGMYYRAVKAKKGMTVPLGSVIQTVGFGRARVTFPSGDQITVSKSSFYKIGYDRKAKKKVSELMFGSIRGLVRNKGAKEKLEVKTRTMVMGVRGTDFFVSARDRSGGSVVNVLRGKVAVAQLPPADQGRDGSKAKNRKAKPLKMVEIPAGFSVKVQPRQASRANKGKSSRRRPPALKVKPTTKKQLVAVQVETVIKERAGDEEPMNPELAKKVAKLEAKATESCLADIKEYNPALYASMKAKISEGGTMPSVDAIQTNTVKAMIKKAPAASANKGRKPTAQELEAIDQDIYNRYFN